MIGMMATGPDLLPLFIWVGAQEPHLPSPVTEPLLPTAPAVQKQGRGHSIPWLAVPYTPDMRNRFQNEKGIIRGLKTGQNVYNVGPAVACCKNMHQCFLSCVLGFCVCLGFFYFPRTISGVPQKTQL